MDAKQSSQKTPPKHISGKFSLTKQEREVIVSHLPKNYTLIDVKEWAVFFTKQEEKKAEEERQKQARKKYEVKKEEMMENMTIRSGRMISNIQGEHSSARKLSQPKQEEKPSIVKPQDTPAKQSEQSKPEKTAYGLQQTIILKLIAKVVNHPQFTSLYYAKIEPSTDAQIRSMKEKLKENYTLSEFHTEINHLFEAFFDQAGPNEPISTLRDFINNSIKTQLARIKTIPALNQNANQSPEHGHNTEEPSRSQSKQPISSKIEDEESDFQGHRDESSSKEGKESAFTKQRIKNESIVARSADSFISGKDIATLGFNIQKLSSTDLKRICQNYISGSKDKININHQNFHLDIEALSKKDFCQLELYVKNRLRSAGIPYERPPEEDDSFMIRDDDEEQV